jgi:tripeptide aminopeptidase
MTNAVRVMTELILGLPQNRTPETTEGREGYLHPITMSGNVSEVKAHFLVRDYTEEGLHELEDVLRRAAAEVQHRYPAARIEIAIQESYRNMKYMIDTQPKVVEYAEEAVRRAGLTPKHESIRGGTDGARLSYMGLLTPNLFDGSMNFHGKKEWVPLEWMDKAVETVLNLLEIWVERSC